MCTPMRARVRPHKGSTRGSESVHSRGESPWRESRERVLDLDNTTSPAWRKSEKEVYVRGEGPRSEPPPSEIEHHRGARAAIHCPEKMGSIFGYAV